MERVFVTLSTDMGLCSSTVAGMKALILELHPLAVVTDITHRISPTAKKSGIYPLLASYRHFPVGSYHLVLADVYEGTDHRLVMVRKDGHYFVLPGNELLPYLAVDAEDCWTVHSFAPGTPHAEWVRQTVQCIGAQKTAGSTEAMGAGPTGRGYKLFPGGIDCPILHYNRFGNIVLDLTKEHFYREVGDSDFRIPVSRRQEIRQIGTHYGQVAEGDPLGYFNAGGYLEIALNRASAARELGLEGCSPAQLRYRSVRIFLR